MATLGDCIRTGRKAALFVEALTHLMAARALVAMLPFAWLTRLLVYPKPNRSDVRSRREADQERVDRVRRVILTAARVPFLRAVCLPQALAAHWMLGRRGVLSSICFGVKRGEKGLCAHAWLVCGGERVLGGAVASEFALIAELPADLRPERDG